LTIRENQQAKQVEISKNQIDHTHKYAELRMRNELNRITNHYTPPQITDRTVLDAYLLHTNKSKYHIIHSYPSEELLPYLKIFYKEFGADVLVNDFVLRAIHITPTMPDKSIFQFSSIYTTDIKDITLLRNLQIRLVNGIKII
jgi:hypothetical protein